MTNTTVKDVTVRHEGTTLILPIVAGKEMSYDEAIVWLDRKKKEEEQEVRIFESIPCSPLDGAHAFREAIVERYGFSCLGSWFSPATLVGVPISVTEKVQVPLGTISIPGIEGSFEAKVSSNPPAFIIGGSVKRKYELEVKAIVGLTRKILSERSIYKGRAVRVSWDWERQGTGYHPINNAPQFFSLDPDAEKILTFSERVAADLEIGLFTLIEKREQCRKYQIPLKRGVLLYGKYGTGKTLTATVAAIRAERSGTTFVYLDSVLDLRRGLEFAAQYAPSVVFCEDIDRAISGERTTEMDEVLNLIDGVDTKDKEIITVLTTNHIDKINPAMLRMGRIDTLIEVTPPDARAASRLVELYGRGLLAGDADLTRIGERLAGKIPAFIRETVERGKIAAIARCGDKDITGSVCEEDLLRAAGNLETHDAFLTPKKSVSEFMPVDRFFVRGEKVEANGHMPEAAELN